MIFEIENGMSSTKTVEVASIKSATFEITDVKFIDDDELVLAASNKSKQYQISHTIASDAEK